MSKDLGEALRLLTGTDPNAISDAPKPLNDRGAAAKQKASTLNTAKGSGGGGPLTETAYTARTWYGPRSLQSVDGVWTLIMKPIKSISFTDAQSNPLVMNFDDKPT